LPAPTVQSVSVAMSRNPMQPSLGMEHEAAGPNPAAGERCRLRIAVEAAAERDCDVLAVHKDVGQCFSL
jgi:hypothetical protein